jgi:hypothetical protein
MTRCQRRDDLRPRFAFLNEKTTERFGPMREDAQFTLKLYQEGAAPREHCAR